VAGVVGPQPQQPGGETKRADDAAGDVEFHGRRAPTPCRPHPRRSRMPECGVSGVPGSAARALRTRCPAGAPASPCRSPGSAIETRRPPRSSGSISSRPPCVRTIDAPIDSPRPTPSPVLAAPRRRNGSVKDAASPGRNSGPEFESSRRASDAGLLGANLDPSAGRVVPDCVVDQVRGRGGFAAGL
jgi:hypothetical protein